jgi:hypothetical protein
MTSYCQLKTLNAAGPLYPVPSIPSLFLPRFNNFTDVDSIASYDNGPRLPYIVAPICKQAPISYGLSSKKMYSNLPAGVANYDRLSIRNFNDIDSVYSWRQRGGY